MPSLGYAGRILTLDLSSQGASTLSTLDYVDRFVGGEGIAAKLYWDEVPPQAGAFDAENALIFASGPLAGIPVFGGSRWVVCGKSPAPSPEHFSHCNLGGRWGIDLKFAGYDAIMVRGKSQRPTYLYVHDDVAEFRDASALWGKGAIATRETLKAELGSSVSVAAIGPAAENMSSMATLLADDDATGAAGMGAVMGSKKLKAIVVKPARKRMKVARPEKLSELTAYFRGLGKETISTVGGVELRVTGPGTRRAPCYGCLGNCLRRTYEAKDGQKGKFMCQAAIFYQLFQPMAGIADGPAKEDHFRAAKLCDDYGLDIMALTLAMVWLYGCYASGILTDESTGIPISKLGSLEFVQTLVRKISTREGFGDVLAQGLPKAADLVGPGARAPIAAYLSKAGLPSINDPRFCITTALLHATEPKPPLPQLQELSRVTYKWLEWHNRTERGYVSPEVVRRIAKRFWGSEIAGDLSTPEGKPLAAKMIQDREYAKECLILCSFIWPIMDLEHTEDHVGDPALEAKILSAVTGNDVDENELNRIGERVFNLERAILVREGHRGREDDSIPDAWHTIPLEADWTNPECVVPGKGGQALSRIGSVLDRGEFQKMKDEYYQLRQWDVVTGLQTRAKLEELGLADVAQDLEQRGLVS